MNGEVNTQSPWYPYVKVYEGFSNMTAALDIPRKVMNYILDMPTGNYTPIDNNSYPRALLWKYLYYDEERPEDNPLPTPEQKMSVLFNPDDPTHPVDPQKGWRIIPQQYIKQAQEVGQTRIYIYMGRTVASNDMEEQLSIAFDIWSNYVQESNTKTNDAYSRVFAIEQALIHALHGIDIAGVGSVYFNRAMHSDCGSTPIVDNNSNVGRHLVLGVQLKSETPQSVTKYNSKTFGNNSNLTLF